LRKAILTLICLLSLVVIFQGCGSSKVTRYQTSRIASFAWADDTLLAYVKLNETGFISNGVKRNPKHSTELWLAQINPQSGDIDSIYQIRQVNFRINHMEFFPGGNSLFYSTQNGVNKVDLATGRQEDFFSHPSIQDYPKEILIGPGEEYVVIVVDAEGIPESEELLDLFMIDMESGVMVFHTDSLVDSRSFAFASNDCIVYISPDPWEENSNRIMQFGMNDFVIKPSDMTEEEVYCNCPQPALSASGMWEAQDNEGTPKIVFKE